jgi:pimeloyl-ACP methyl ester carboxylesterase
MWQLLDRLCIEQVVLIGTSMGGLMGVVMAAERPGRVQGLVINDVGPEVNSAGLARIMSYVGKSGPVQTWDDAVAQTRAINEVCYPDYRDEQWWKMTRRLYRNNDDGMPVLAYDPAISAPILSNDSAAVPPDMWVLLKQLTGVPVLAFRGALSDILSPDCFVQMQRCLPHMQAVQVTGVGHPPTLDEIEARVAINEFLQALALN